MNIFNSYKRSHFFLWVNIIGLAIGLAASIMLILFVVNELSYDKHFANHDRIIRLANTLEVNGEKNDMPITLRKAYTEIPAKVPGIEAATQIYEFGQFELIYNSEHFQKLNFLLADSSFFRVFQMKFLAGTPETALVDKKSLVITNKYANIIFGSPANAIGKTVSILGQEAIISAVVQEFPVNTHFTFDIMANLGADNTSQAGGLEFLTYYLISPSASMPDVRANIKKEYNAIYTPFTAQFNGKGHGVTEKLTDIYLHSTMHSRSEKSNDMKFVWVLIIISLSILVLAVINFVNLFMAQCETRMNEIAIRKTNGASIGNIVRQFFTEVSGIVLLAFLIGLFLAVVATPYFSQLIHKDIDLRQLLNPQFVLCAIGLFVITVTLSAAYPSFYMSRFTPLDILGKRLKFSKRQLATILIVFQSVITIVLVSYILVINKQTNYLKSLPLNYNPENVMVVPANMTIMKSAKALEKELSNTPGIQKASAANHFVGGGGSGQGIALLEDREKSQFINEYRVFPGICEIMGLQLVEGSFFKEDAPDSVLTVVLNEAAVKMLGLKAPVTGTQVEYKGTATIIGVVKDFIFGDPTAPIAPLVLTTINASPGLIYIKFADNIDRQKAQNLALSVFHKFDPEFVINPMWSEDIYMQKFDNFDMQFKVVLIGSLLSVFVAMIGLLAMHLYTAKRRTKEIGIRRINGATVETIFSLLSWDIIKWIFVAGIIAIPVAWYVASDWLNNYGNHTQLSWWIFAIPLLLQCLIALITTSGVTLSVSLQNPVKALKTE
jgi:putative ABC transport system permease protein